MIYREAGQFKTTYASDQAIFPIVQDRIVVAIAVRSEEHTSELQSRLHLVCRLLLEKKKRVCIIGHANVEPRAPPPSPPDDLPAYSLRLSIHDTRVRVQRTFVTQQRTSLSRQCRFR